MTTTTIFKENFNHEVQKCFQQKQLTLQKEEVFLKDPNFFINLACILPYIWGYGCVYNHGKPCGIGEKKWCFLVMEWGSNPESRESKKEAISTTPAPPMASSFPKHKPDIFLFSRRLAKFYSGVVVAAAAWV